MTARFHAPDVHAEGELVTLPDDEAQHLTRVLRLTSGARIVIFDGRGREFDAIVEELGKPSVVVRVGTARIPTPETRLKVTLAQAVLKGDKMDQVVRDAVMLGAAAIQPLVTTRTEVTIEALERGQRQERWRRIAVSSAKQCGRAVVPVVEPPASLERVFTSAGMRLLLVEPSAPVDAKPITELRGNPPATATLIVGPEGGWTPEELARASACCELVRLGSRTLRADAVSIVGLTALFTIWNEFT